MTTEIEALKPIEMKSVGLAQFEGQRVKIESAEVITVRSKFAKSEDGESEVLKVTSVPLGTIQDRDSKEFPPQASELFNLTRDEDGVLGWPTAAKGKLANFMKKCGVKHPSELVGKEATVRIRKKHGTDGTTREFLGLITERTDRARATPTGSAKPTGT